MKYFLVSGHYVYFDFSNSPATNHRASIVLPEADRSKFFCQLVVVVAIHDFDDQVNIDCSAHGRPRHICYQQTCGAATDKHETVAQFTESLNNYLNQSNVGIVQIHESRISKSCAARSRSRAAPILRESNNANASYSELSFLAAIGTVGYNGYNATPRCSPLGSGQIGGSSPVCRISWLKGGAAYAVGIPLVTAPSTPGKAYLAP